MPRRRLLEVLLLLASAASLAALLWQGCPEPRVPSRASFPVAVPTPATVPAPPRSLGSQDRLGILGIRLGMTRREVETMLGPGRTLEVRHGVETIVYGRREHCRDPARQDRWATVDWGEDGIVHRVEGSHIHLDGREVLGRGWSVLQAPAVLGQGSPFGSGAIDFYAARVFHARGRILYFQMGGRC